MFAKVFCAFGMRPLLLGPWTLATAGWSSFHIVRTSLLLDRMPYQSWWLLVTMALMACGLGLASGRRLQAASSRTRLYLIIHVGFFCLVCLCAEVLDMTIYLFPRTNLWPLLDLSEG